MTTFKKGDKVKLVPVDGHADNWPQSSKNLIGGTFEIWDAGQTFGSIVVDWCDEEHTIPNILVCVLADFQRIHPPCECGQAKLGFPPGPRHSYYCPQAQP